METTFDPLEQRRAALDRANYIRFERAKLKRALASRRRNPYSVLKDVPTYADGMPVHQFLAVLPGIGRSKVDRLLNVCKLPPNKRLGDLTERQRGILARSIKEKAWLMK